ncbi:TonB-dependent receptor plug domain-containing protein [Alcanivorax sp. IO_7]|nr:TonB-dependent receptor plug domain-containing protein [Alcanivorax sp. IO_7]
MKNRTRRRRCLPLALLCSAVQADDTPSRFELGVLEPVVVDGTRADFSDATTEDTVDADDMARFNRTDVSQALELLPGVNTVMMGGRSERLINVRGFDSRQVPLFIDGVPVYVPYDGNIDLSRLTTYDVAEISLSKGYTSLLAGPNTLGGAINVVSRRPRLGTEAEAGYGMSFDDRFSHNAWDSHANVGTNQGLWYAQVGGSIRDQDYFRWPAISRPPPTKTAAAAKIRSTRIANCRCVWASPPTPPTSTCSATTSRTARSRPALRRRRPQHPGAFLAVALVRQGKFLLQLQDPAA